eukprot:2858487-Alexandrium_andersonii.AAC.1
MIGLQSGAKAWLCWAAAASLFRAMPVATASARDHILLHLTFPELDYRHLSAFQPLRRPGLHG